MFILKESFEVTGNNIEELLNFIKTEFTKEFKRRRWFKGELEFDDVDWNSYTISFQLYVYPDAIGKKMFQDHFTFSIDYEDADSDTIEEAKEVLASRIPDQISEFIAYVMRKGR